MALVFLGIARIMEGVAGSKAKLSRVIDIVIGFTETSARLTIGKRISDRAHVTLSRTLTGANQDIIVVLEYDQNDRLSWILSQNEDRTYALDVRVRHTF